MSKVVVYCRVSTENQEAEGTSLDTQERACLAKAHELAGPGDELVVLREVYSGLSLERPELASLRDWVRAGQVKGVVVYSADRLARDGLHLLLLVEEFEKAGAVLAFVTEPHQSTPEGQLLTFVRGWASKLEALKIKERTVRGRKERARKGLIPNGVGLYGYLYLKGKGESRGIRIPDRDKAKVVTDIFEWYVHEGLPLVGIASRLHALGVAAPGGKPTWFLSTIRAILRNPAYTGRTVTHWAAAEETESPGATPALVDQGTLKAAQERLRLNRENSRRRMKRDYPLRGLVFCGTCGARLIGQGNGHGTWWAYRCPGRQGVEKHTCCANSLKLEADVWAAVRGLLAQPELIRRQIQGLRRPRGTADLERRLSQVEARLKSLGQGEAAIARQLRQGLMSEAVANSELRQAQKDREGLERERASIKGQMEAAQQWQRLDLDALCAQALSTLEAPTAEIKRTALEALGARVTINGESVKVSVNLSVDSSLSDLCPSSPPPTPKARPTYPTRPWERLSASPGRRTAPPR